MRRLLAAVLCLSLFSVLSSFAHSEEVDLELVLAIDVSGSIDEEEAKLQRQGYLQAFVDKEIIRAITSGAKRKIAVTYIEWAGEQFQRTVADWHVIHDAASAQVFASRVAEIPVSTERWTSISAAIDYSMKRFSESPHKSGRRVIDISGDGRNNNGRDIESARAAALNAGVVINGLPVINDRPQRWGGPPERDLDKYYADYVIGGPGSFLVVARGFEDFALAIRTKLLREISDLKGPRIQVAGVPLQD